MDAPRDRRIHGSHSPDMRVLSPGIYGRHFSGLLADPVLLWRGPGTVWMALSLVEHIRVLEYKAEAHSEDSPSTLPARM